LFWRENPQNRPDAQELMLWVPNAAHKMYGADEYAAAFAMTFFLTTLMPSSLVSLQVILN